MKRLTLVISLLVALSLLLAACAPVGMPVPTSTPKAITLKDGLERTVSLPGPAQKIISLAPSNTEILFAIGAGNQVIGRDDFSDYPQEVKNLPSVGGSMSNYNLEVITQLQPDLVLASDLNTPEQVKALEDLGLAVYLLSNPLDMEGLYQNVITIGQLTGREAEAQTLVKSLKERVDKVVKAVNATTDRPLVFYEIDGTEPAKPWTTGPGTFMDVLIQMAGGRNIGSSLKAPWAQISQEELIAQNPDVILLGDAAYGVTPEQIAARPGWKAIRAVQNQKIFSFDDNLVSRPGPRLVEGLETLAALLHPELTK